MRVEVHTGEGVPREQAERAAKRITAINGSPDGAADGRLTLRRSSGQNGSLFLADASVVVDGRRFVAYATGDTALAAAEEAADRITGQVDRAVADPRILVPRKWIRWAHAARRGWTWRGQALVRELRFRDFDEAMLFLQRVARRAEDYTRRPDIWISSNRVRLTIANLHHGPITLAELRLAAKVNSVVEELSVSRDGLPPS